MTKTTGSIFSTTDLLQESSALYARPHLVLSTSPLGDFQVPNPSMGISVPSLRLLRVSAISALPSPCGITGPRQNTWTSLEHLYFTGVKRSWLSHDELSFQQNDYQTYHQKTRAARTVYHTETNQWAKHYCAVTVILTKFDSTTSRQCVGGLLRHPTLLISRVEMCAGHAHHTNTIPLEHLALNFPSSST
eukprot:4401380-Amphidinium_carterae.1